MVAVAGRSAAAQSSGQVNNGGAAFLLLPVGARAAALGQAAVADGGTTEAAFWNPAGLATMPQSEIAFHHAQTFASQNNAIAGYFASHSVGVFGVSAYLVDYGSQEVVPGPDQPTVGTLDPKNVELIASYAAPLGGGLTFGVSYKVVQFRQDCTGQCGNFRSLVGTTHAVDVGMQFSLRDDALRFGVVVRHAGFPLQVENRAQADPLPTQVEAGLAYRLFLPGAADAERLDARLLVDLKDSWGEYGNPDAHIGVELGYGETIRLRTGYALVHSDGEGPSIGFGAKFGGLSIDFARVFFTSGTFDEPVFLSVRVAL
jgi:hypothetical protein